MDCLIFQIWNISNTFRTWKWWWSRCCSPELLYDGRRNLLIYVLQQS